MNLLVIGGTRFVGKHIVDAALSQGHQVTLFNRGQSRSELVEGTEEITGDRETDLDQLKGRKWDAVIDTCGYLPRVVGLSAEALKDAVNSYLFISSISVYADNETPNQTEDTQLITLDDPTVEEINAETYGGLKVLCEQCVTDVYGDRTLIVRPGYVVGPYDSTDRFTYWPVRFSSQAEFVVPDSPDASIQFIDGRDLAEFCIKLLEDQTKGTFHACGPTPPIPFAQFVSRGAACFDNTSKPIWIKPKELIAKEIEPSRDFPIFGSYDGTGEALLNMDNSRAVNAGLKQRTLEVTLKDTIDWWNTDHQNEEGKAGLTKEREQELINELKKESAPS